MKLAKSLILCALMGALLASPAGAGVREEHVTGGVLNLVWVPGLTLPNGDVLPNVMNAAILDPADPAYANPSGDHTVGVATNSAAPDSGGAILTCTEPAGLADYSWEAWSSPAPATPGAGWWCGPIPPTTSSPATSS